MNNQMKIFENEQFGKVRIIQENDKYLFCGSDVAKALGYKLPRKAITDHCKGVLKRNGVSQTTNQHGKTTNQTVEMSFIPEGDVYRLITHSKLPSAEKFEKWVFDDVLPSIRKTGGYIAGEENMSDEELVARALLIAHKKIEERDAKIAAQDDEIRCLTASNKVLAGEALEWSDPAILNALVRKYASAVYGKNNFGFGWREFFKELYYNHHISLEQRKTAAANSDPKAINRPTYTFLSKDEIPVAIQTAVSMCEHKNVDIASILNDHMKNEPKNTVA